MADKQQLLTALRAELDRWEALLATLDEAQLTAPEFAEGWSIKDVVAHLHQWQERSVARLEAALRGGEPRYPAWPEDLDPEMEGQPDELNAWLYAQVRDQPWSVVRQEWSAGFRQLLQLADQIPEPDLLDTTRYSWMEGYAVVDVLEGTLEHHQEHAEYLAPVLERER